MLFKQAGTAHKSLQQSWLATHSTPPHFGTSTGTFEQLELQEPALLQESIVKELLSSHPALEKHLTLQGPWEQEALHCPGLTQESKDWLFESAHWESW